MSTGTQIRKVQELTSVGKSTITRNGNLLSRFWNRLAENIGTGSRKPANYESMTISQLEQRAQEDMAIAKTMGF